jgi:hypothetical protein
MEAVLTRFEQTSRQILGDLKFGDYTWKTLELPWRDNKRMVSCIPTGIYNVVPRYSQKYGSHFEVKNVKDRTAILIHAGNFYNHTNGCILVGMQHKDVNKDGLKDLINSKNALNQMLLFLPKISFELKVIYEPKFELYL